MVWGRVEAPRGIRPPPPLLPQSSSTLPQAALRDARVAGQQQIWRNLDPCDPIKYLAAAAAAADAVERATAALR